MLSEERSPEVVGTPPLYHDALHLHHYSPKGFHYLSETSDYKITNRTGCDP